MSILKISLNSIRVISQIYQSMISPLIAAWMDAFMNKSSQNMNAYMRWEVFIIGCVLLGITMTTDTPLHWIVLLPLLSIYLINTAIFGYEPLYNMVRRAGAYLRKYTLIPKPHA